MGQNNSVDSTQSVFNDVISASVESCKASCVSNDSNNTVIFDGGRIGGNVNVLNQTCQAKASCLMDQVSQLDIDSIVTNVATQKNQDFGSLFGNLGNLSSNSEKDRQTISNYITQILQSTCQADVWMQSNNNFIYYSANTGGDFNALNSGDSSTSAVASCTMSNIAKLKVSNSASNSVTQSNTSVGLFGMIALVLILLILFPIIFIIIRGAIGGKKGNKQNDELLNVLKVLQAGK